MAAPWTQSLSLRWRPALTFYATRIAILDAFDDRKVLRAFRVGDDQIDARILTGHELSVRQNGLSLEVFGQDADLDEVWEFVSIAFEKINPAPIGGVLTQFQHIVPLDVAYEEAVPMARDSFLAPIGGEEVKDWALIVNLAGGPRTAANRGPSVEFGIINAQEARNRLNRVVGRMVSRSTSGLSAPSWENTEFPAVALFADSKWPQDDDAEHEQLSDVRAYLDTTRERACNFVDSLYKKITVEQEIGGSVEP